jgi:hypothetical protein
MTPPYEFRSPAAEIVGQRLAALSDLMNNEIRILVTSIPAVIEPTISRSDFEKGRLQIRTGEETDIDFLSEKLVILGFQKVTMVEEVGELARALRKRANIKRHGKPIMESEAQELADVFMYVVHLANVLGLDLSKAVRDKELLKEEIGKMKFTRK